MFPGLAVLAVLPVDARLRSKILPVLARRVVAVVVVVVVAVIVLAAAAIALLEVLPLA